MSAARPAAGRRPPRADLLTIGEVLAELREDFPATTHSKVRFLEERGLVTPARTPSGYRRFSREHLARLRLVLTLQRERYLPLKVIAEHLAALDAGADPDPAPAQPDPAPPPTARREPHRPPPGEGPTPPSAPPPPVDAPTRAHAPQPPAAPPTFADLVDLAGGDAALVSALGDHGLLPDPGHQATTTVVTAAAALASYGIEPRHLRALRTAAEREATLIEAVAAPLRRARTGPAGDQHDAAAAASEAIATTFADLRAALLAAALPTTG